MANIWKDNKLLVQGLRHLNLGWGFSDELVATGLLLAVMVTGSFFYLSRLTSRHAKQELAAGSNQGNQEQVLGSVNEADSSDENVLNEAVVPTASPTPTASASAKPSSAPPGLATPVLEIPYGAGQLYENDKYFIEFVEPKLVSSSSRVFKVKVVIGNISVSEGITNRLHATVIKDGLVLIDEAAMSISEVKQIFPGQKLTFSASLSLVEETDVTKLIFNPGDGLPVVTHTLQ